MTCPLPNGSVFDWAMYTSIARARTVSARCCSVLLRLSRLADEREPYENFFSTPISLVVTEDGKLGLETCLRQLAQPGMPFECTFGDVLDRHERHFNLFGRPPNPLAVVRRFVEALKAEFYWYWKASHVDGWYDEKDRHGKDGPEFSLEDSRRSGSYFAEALATYFMERRVGVPPGRIFFYDGTEARPDFLSKPKRNRPLAAALSGRPLLGIEVRSRKGSKIKRDLHKRDVDDLKRKIKGGKASKILAIYALYGVNTPAQTLTRIHLADPDEPGTPVSEHLVREAALSHYWGVCSRLGIWSRRQILSETLMTLDSAKYDLLLGNDDAAGDVVEFLKTRTIPAVADNDGAISYKGREFSTMIADYQAEKISLEDALASIDQGDYGTTFFRGLRMDLLDAIQLQRAGVLESFLDENSGRRDIEGRVSPDGILTQETPDRREDVREFFEQEMRKPPERRSGKSSPTRQP